MSRTVRLLLLASLLLAGAVVSLALAAIGETARVSIHDDDTTEPNEHSLGAAVSADGRYVAFTTKAQLTAANTNGKEQLYVRDRQTGATVLASASAAGAAANDNVESDANLFDPQYAISGDGRYVVFTTTANNLATPDANGVGNDVFRKDLQTGAIIVVNVSAAGVQSNAVLGDPDVSYDGSRIVFRAAATTTGLLTPDTAGTEDIVLRDVVAGTTTRVSQNSAGAQSTQSVERSAISADGRHVVFQVPNDDAVLIPGDANGASDLVVRDTRAGTTTAASVSTTGTTPGGAGFPDISGDGRYVAFEAPATFAPGTAEGSNNVYRRDMVSSTTELISARNGLAEGGNNAALTASSDRPAISANGSRVVFRSTAEDLLVPFGGSLTEDTNDAVADVYYRDPAATPATSATGRASTRTNGTQGALQSTHAAISGNGGLVAFTYDAGAGANLSGFTGPADTNAKSDVFVKELAPSDSTGPAIALTGPLGAAQRTDATQVTVSATVAADPSGNVETTIGGTPVTRAADGTVSRIVPLTLGVNTISITARDGAGNLSTGSVAVERVTPATVTPVTPPPTVKIKASRITNLKVIPGLTKITMRFQLSRRGTIRVELKKLPRLTAVRKPFVRFKRIGKNSIVMPIPRLSPGKYRLILTTKSKGGTTRITRTFVVKK